MAPGHISEGGGGLCGDELAGESSGAADRRPRRLEGGDGVASSEKESGSWTQHFCEPVIDDGQLDGYEEPYDGRWGAHRLNARPGTDRPVRRDAQAEGEPAPAGRFAGIGPRRGSRSDVRIEEELVQRLAEAEWVEASNIEVEVVDGVVTLVGEIATREERRAAAELAAEVAGVVDVIDRLRARADRPLISS